MRFRVPSAYRSDVPGRSDARSQGGCGGWSGGLSAWGRGVGRVGSTQTPDLKLAPVMYDPKTGQATDVVDIDSTR
jgi:hypothetical protein